MEKKKPRRLMRYNKIRKNVGRETLIHREKNKYNRNAYKRRLKRAVDKCLVDLEECGAE